MPTAMISGGFDPLTTGHLDLIEAAARRGLVVVALNSDAWLIRKKGYVVMPFADRRRILLALRNVRDAVPVDDSDGTVCEAIRRIRPDCFCNGGDRIAPHPAEEAVCRELGIMQIFGTGGRKTRSSSEIIGRLRHHHRQSAV